MKSIYSPTIGYSSPLQVNLEKLRRVIAVNSQMIDDYCVIGDGNKILVAGSGTGHEAWLLHERYRQFTVGVDLSMQTHLISQPPEFKKVGFSEQDISALGFPPEQFSLVYCYHVLEHVLDPRLVIEEFHRVLTPNGILFIGFPNKNRWIGYVGTSQNVSLAEKLKWNLNDTGFRLRGKFENRFGAHAGFSETEFLTLSANLFANIIPLRDQYLSLKYPRFQKLFALIKTLNLDDVVFPSNYFICIKQGK